MRLAPCESTALGGQEFLPFLPYPSANSVIFNPYDETDETARLIQSMQPLYKAATGFSLEVKHIPGRGGATALNNLLRAPADGYTLSLFNIQTLLIQSSSKSTVYSMAELEPVCLLAEAPLALWVPSSSPFKSLDDLLEAARAVPEGVKIAGTGRNTQQHLLTLRLNRLTGVKTIYLPFTGTSSAQDAAASGQAHAFWGYATPLKLSPGTARPIAIADDARRVPFESCPTFKELKIDLVEKADFGLTIPAKTPVRIAQKAGAIFRNLAADPDFAAKTAPFGFTPKPMDNLELGAYLRSQKSRYESMMEDYGLEVRP